LTVGASDINDFKASFSNFGSCLDLSAPGVDIVSAWIGSNSATAVLSGTSMASPFTCGVMALAWQQNKNLLNTDVQNLVKSWTTPNVIDGSSQEGGGKNLLYSLINPFVSPPVTPQPPPPTIIPIKGSNIRINLFIIFVIFILNFII
jgi:subtilisin family serine protease